MSLSGKNPQAHEEAIESVVSSNIKHPKPKNIKDSNVILPCTLITAGLEGSIKTWDAYIDTTPDTLGHSSLVEASTRLPSFSQPHPLGIVKLAITSSNSGEYVCSNSIDGSGIHIYHIRFENESLCSRFLGQIPSSPVDCWGLSCIATSQYLKVFTGAHTGSLNIYQIPLDTLSSSRSILDISPQSIDLGCKFIHDICSINLPSDPNTSLVAVATESGSVYMVNATSNPTIQSTLSEHVKSVRKVAFSLHGNWLYSAGDDQKINIYKKHSSGSWSLDGTLSGHSSWILSLAVKTDKEDFWLASGSADGQVLIWNTESRECLYTFSHHVDQVFGLAFISPCNTDDAWVASVSGDKDILIYSLASKKSIQD
jgi:WD40 repeat protein